MEVININEIIKNFQKICAKIDALASKRGMKLGKKDSSTRDSSGIAPNNKIINEDSTDESDLKDLGSKSQDMIDMQFDNNLVDMTVMRNSSKFPT